MLNKGWLIQCARPVGCVLLFAGLASIATPAMSSPATSAAVEDETAFLLTCTDNSGQWSRRFFVDPSTKRLGVYTSDGLRDEVAWMDYQESPRMYRALLRGDGGLQAFDVNRYTLEFWYRLELKATPQENRELRGKCVAAHRMI